MRQFAWGDRVAALPCEAAGTARRTLAALTIISGSVLRLLPWLAGYPLHRDEALYGTWARLIAGGTDPYLLTAWLDKPPLALYALAGSLKLFGAGGEWALRVPGMLASIVLLPLVYLLAQRAYRSATVSLLATLLVTVSPSAILFAPTAFTDPWLALWLVAAAAAALGGRDGRRAGERAKERKSNRRCETAMPAPAIVVPPTRSPGPTPETGFLNARVRNRVSGRDPVSEGATARPSHARHAFLAGLFLGLAVASKQQGLLGIPLVAGLLAIPDGRERRSLLKRRLIPALAGFLLIFVPLAWWDSLRWAKRPSFWDRSLTTYGGLGVAPITAWPERALDWLKQLGYLWGHPALTAILLLAAAAAALLAWRRLRHARQSQRARQIDLALAGFVAAYLAVHFILTFQVWDRYLLPLVPLLSILAARGLLHLWDGLSRRHHPVMRLAGAATLGLAIAAAAWLGATGRVPVGGDHGAYAGLTRVVEILRTQPADTIIYHQSLGWYLDYYLFDAPQERRWWDTAWRLADDAGRSALREPERGRWLVATSEDEKSLGQAAGALARRDLRLIRQQQVWRPDGTRSFVLYQIVPAEGERAD